MSTVKPNSIRLHLRFTFVAIIYFVVGILVVTRDE